MAIPDPSVTDWVPIWHPESAGAQGPPGATGPIGPQGPAGVNGTAAPHQVTHQVGGTDELVNNAWKDRNNNFTAAQQINAPNAFIVLNNTLEAVDNKIFRILSGNGSLFISALNDAQSAVMGEVFMNRTGSINTGLGGVFAGGGFAGPNYNFVSPVDVSNPTVLDHYEEGNWTPAVSSDGGVPSIGGYQLQTGYYTRIGRLVHCDFDLSVNNVTGGSGLFRITGLPFLNGSGTNSNGFITYFVGLAGGAAVSNLFPFIIPGANWIYLAYKNVVSSQMDGNVVISFISGTRILGSVIYMTYY